MIERDAIEMLHSNAIATSAIAPAPGFPAVSIAQAHALLGQPGSMFEVDECEIRGVRIKIWKNAPPTLREVFELSRPFAAREHLIYEDERVTFGALHAAVARIATHLTSMLAKGDRVAIIMRNLPEWPVAFWAITLAGGIATPLNAWCTGRELQFGLKDSGARIAIVDPERWERIREYVATCPALEQIYVVRASREFVGARAKRLENIVGATAEWLELPHTALPRIALAPDDDAAIFYTSGTTGKPKGAVLTHRNIVSSILNSLSAQARAYLRRGEPPPQVDASAPQKVFLLSVPFFHVTGCFVVMIARLMSGAKVVLQRRWNADTALPLIEKERVTGVGGVPTIAWQLLEHPRVDEYDLSSLEMISYGGAPAPPELLRRIRERLPKVLPVHTWGMTENAAVALTNLAEDYQLRPTSCGAPSLTGEAKIMNQEGREMPAGEVGELWYRGPTVARGYWRNQQATAETFVAGWLRTGDLARRDDEGFFYIVDRAKDMLIRGGENIYCVELENTLYEHPAVMEAAIIGLPHKTLGEEPAAVVHLKPQQTSTEQELRHWVGSRLAAFKVPVRIVLSLGPLPRNPQGKILKSELKVAFRDYFTSYWS